MIAFLYVLLLLHHQAPSALAPHTAATRNYCDYVPRTSVYCDPVPSLGPLFYPVSLQAFLDPTVVMISLKPNHPTLKRGATCQESPKGRSVKCRAQLLQGDPSHAVYEVSQRMTMTLLPNPIAPAWPILQRCCRVYHEVIVHVGLTDRDFRYDDQKARWSCDYDEIFYRKKDEGERGECAKLIPQKGNGACPIRSPQPVFELATTYSGCKTPPPAPQIA